MWHIITLKGKKIWHMPILWRGERRVLSINPSRACHALIYTRMSASGHTTNIHAYFMLASFIHVIRHAGTMHACNSWGHACMYAWVVGLNKEGLGSERWSTQQLGWVKMLRGGV